MNRPNLLEHINPSREFADLILNKSFDHSILSLEILRSGHRPRGVTQRRGTVLLDIQGVINGY